MIKPWHQFATYEKNYVTRILDDAAVALEAHNRNRPIVNSEDVLHVERANALRSAIYALTRTLA